MNDENKELPEAPSARYFPSPKEFKVYGPDVTMFDRYRVVISAYDREMAMETVEMLKDQGCPCDVEQFVAYVDSRNDVLLGEVIVSREFFAACFVPAPEEVVEIPA